MSAKKIVLKQNKKKYNRLGVHRMKKCQPCSIAAAVGFAIDICQQENIFIASLIKIKEEGYTNDQDVLRALEEFNSKVPESRRIEAKAIKCFAFSDNEECKL